MAGDAEVGAATHAFRHRFARAHADALLEPAVRRASRDVGPAEVTLGVRLRFGARVAREREVVVEHAKEARCRRARGAGRVEVLAVRLVTARLAAGALARFADGPAITDALDGRVTARHAERRAGEKQREGPRTGRTH